MAKAVITIADTEDSTVSVSLELDPPAKGDDMPTTAQYIGLAALQFIGDMR